MSSQSKPSSQKTDLSSSQQTDPSSENSSSQSSQLQTTFQQRPTQRTSNTPRQQTFGQRPFQQRTNSPQQRTFTRGRPTTRRPFTYHGYPYSLTVDLPPREEQQQKVELPSAADISSQQQKVELPSAANISSQQKQDISPQKQQQIELPSRAIVSSQKHQQPDLSSQHRQVDIRQQSDLTKRYRVPKSYAAAVSGVINPSSDPMKHEETVTETETGTHNSHNSNYYVYYIY
jgi:hypothetical protein